MIIVPGLLLLILKGELELGPSSPFLAQLTVEWGSPDPV